MEMAEATATVQRPSSPQGPGPNLALDLAEVERQFEDATPEEILAWAVETFRGRLCLQSSMQRRSSVLAHMLWEGGWLDVPVLFVDTGFHFAETLEMCARLVSDFGLEVVTARAELTPEAQELRYGCELWRYPDSYELCCHLRKERPFVRAASRYDAVISGLQRHEGGSRAQVPLVGWDPRIAAYTVHPLAHFGSDALAAYLAEHEVPLHPLYAEGYPSIGCATCTTRVQPGEPPRAGRWRHIREALEGGSTGEEPTYCNINWIDQAR
jgi:phosphoadenosine phosphosulfate reductase